MKVLNGHPPLTLLKQIQAAVTGCPSQVFSIEDEENTSEIIIVEDDREE